MSASSLRKRFFRAESLEIPDEHIHAAFAKAAAEATRHVRTEVVR